MELRELSAFWLILPLAIAFGLGWLASRMDKWQSKREPTLAPRAYFKGLNFLLNEQQDKAIDAFIEAVRLDPQTVDLQFALGNLFRRRGEFERSVRVHASLMERGDLQEPDRQRAQFELANDYLKAGLLDRAETNYQGLTSTPFAAEAWQALLAIAERSKHWEHAIEAAKALEARGAGSYQRWVAQYHCELAEAAASAKPPNFTQAQLSLDAALQANPACVRAYLLRGDWRMLQGNSRGALDAWLQIEAVAPSYVTLAAQRLAGLPVQHLDEVLTHLQRWFEQLPSIDTADALVRSLSDVGAQRAVLQDFLTRQKSLSAARRVLNDVLTTKPEEATQTSLAAVQATQAALLAAVERGAQAGQRYRCASCGFEAKNYFWQCPGCLSWEAYPPKRVDDQ